ncbi:MAG: PIN domain-containing protein [Nitrospirota bacterium]
MLSAKRILWALFGFTAGLFVSSLAYFVIDPILFPLPTTSFVVWKICSLLFFITLGIVFALKIEKTPGLLTLRREMGCEGATSKILDTSVIIDGRIADLCETGFLEGTFIIPQFVLQELQYIADSGEVSKRVRGKRGLDILHRLQKLANFDLRIVDDDFPNIREVDAKIVALAKQISAKVVTHDMNLNKVATLQGVFVLNINQLSSALKPVVLPGEVLSVFISKEGKEPSQGIAYMEDGTMIVIDDARKSIGKRVEVSVTSMLQNPGGRMIFARIKGELPERRTSL